MVKFLIRRPIAVFMAVLAFVLLGLVAVKQMPTSLLPDVAIPEISIHVAYPNNSARELETNVVRPLRNSLLQVSHLDDINTETKDGFAVFKLRFSYGTDINYSFIEVNEKIDAATSVLPKELDRPKVIKTSASDIPVLNLYVTQKGHWDEERFLQFSEFAETVIKKRIEQLPEVALADMSGNNSPIIQIIPDLDKMAGLKISTDVLINAIRQNNIELEEFLIKNGIYQYNFKFDNPLRSIEDIKNIFLKVNDRLIQLKDVAEINVKTLKERGQVYNQDSRSIVFSIIKQSGTRINKLKESVDILIANFEKDYPELEFTKGQDQTTLLQYSITNLKWSLIIGSFLAILIMFFFIRDIKTPLIIGLTIPISLIITLLLMHLFGISLNIISLSGLILGIGMMIDNSIIVIDNIDQKLVQQPQLEDAISEGTNEIITPMISSVLTTISVFFPLVFLSGITGALFTDQAISVALSLGTSLLVSIMFIPVAFRLLYKRNSSKKDKNSILGLEKWYKNGFKYFVEFKPITLVIVVMGIISMLYFFSNSEYSKLPNIQKNEKILFIEWNENINLEENSSRIKNILTTINDSILSTHSFLGEQKFLLQRENPLDISQSRLYIKASTPQVLGKITDKIDTFLKNNYPMAIYKFEPSKTVFEYLFGNNDNILTVEIFSKNSLEIPPVENLNKIDSMLSGLAQNQNSLKQTIFIHIDFDKMLLYKVDYNHLISELKSAFNENIVDNLKSEKRFIPIKMDYAGKSHKNIIDNLFVRNNNNKLIPAKNLVALETKNTYNTLYANRKGEYLYYKIANPKSPSTNINTIKNIFKNSNSLKVEFSGTWFDIEKMKDELLVVIIVSLLLLYFIMAAQFESFVLPLIILLEIPIDIGGALFLNYLFDGTINIMSAIGIVVMSGIVINDSILKIHTINMLVKKGKSVKESIILGSKYRLKPILMTSLTTILALSPFLFIGGMGADLQKPLAVVVIGGLLLGTFISLYFIPMMYSVMTKARL